MIWIASFCAVPFQSTFDPVLLCLDNWLEPACSCVNCHIFLFSRDGIAYVALQKKVSNALFGRVSDDLKSLVDELINLKAMDKQTMSGR